MLRKKNGFSLIELLLVVAVIGIITTIVLISNIRAKEKTYLSRADIELKTFAYALKMYAFEHNNTFPDDVNRDLPSGIETYLNTDPEWPSAPWPGSVYDWDNWSIDGENIYQISIRFCPVGGPLSACVFPNESWAQNFNVNSAYYYCVSGSCRSHISEPIDYPGYCMNCSN